MPARTSYTVVSKHQGINTCVVLHTCPNEECIGAIIAYYVGDRNGLVPAYHVPEYEAHVVSEHVPERPRQMLQEANDARQQPLACITTARFAVEAMLAEKGYSERRVSLHDRIDNAVREGVLPAIMGDWAHEVREFGNEGHTDSEPAPLPDKGHALHVLKFANMLAEYLFVLPKQVQKARSSED